MRFARFSTLALALVLALVVAVPLALAAPAKAPLVHLGPQTLTGDGQPPTPYEFFLQPGTRYGDIGGIGSGPTYSMLVTGIDVTGLTGPAGRFVYFNLQDAEEGSQYKHLGINVRLQEDGPGGLALFQAYQNWTWEGQSAHGLNPGVLTEDSFDLRFDFFRAAGDASWTVTPYFRLKGGDWTLFAGGPFTGTLPFDYLGAKFALAFDGGADGWVSFDDWALVLVNVKSQVYLPLVIRNQ